MEVREKIEELVAKNTKQHCTQEEHTKQYIIEPIFNTLGYNIFSPDQILKEYTADIGTKNGEKVDYALFISGSSTPQIIVEAKHWRENLNNHVSQLHRYYPVARAKIAVLTNGISWQFFMDLDRANVMDYKPFWSFDIDNMSEKDFDFLDSIKRDKLNIENIKNKAKIQKNSRKLKEAVKSELENPSDELIRIILKKSGIFGNSNIRQNRIDEMRGVIKSLISDLRNKQAAAVSNTVSNTTKQKIKNIEEDVDLDGLTFVAVHKDGSYNARVKVIDGEFVLLAGSKIHIHSAEEREKWSEYLPYYYDRQQKIIQSGKISSDGRVLVNISFGKTPSTSAVIVSGKSENGKGFWREEKTGRRLSEILEK